MSSKLHNAARHILCETSVEEEVTELTEATLPSYKDLVKGIHQSAHGGMQHFSRVGGKDYTFNYVHKKGGKWEYTNDADEAEAIALSSINGTKQKVAKMVYESTELEEMKAGEGLFKKTSDIDDITTESIPGSGGVLKISDLEIDGEKPNVTKTWKYGVRVGGGYRFFVTLQGAKKFAQDGFDESTELEEAKKPEWSDDMLELSIGKDRNGNKVLKVSILDIRFNIQTNGNLPKTHSGGIGDHTVDELVKHVKAYGSTMQKNAISRYVRMKESTELEEAKKPKEGDMVTWKKKGGREFAVAALDKGGIAWIADDDGEEYEANIRDLTVIETKNEDTVAGDVAGYDKPLMKKTMKRKELEESRKGSGHKVTFKTEGSKWKMFDVPMEVFKKFDTGRIKYERWNKYLNLEDDDQRAVYDYARTKRENTIVLRCLESGALRAIRRRSSNGL